MLPRGALLMDVPVIDVYGTVRNAAAVLVREPQPMALAALAGAFGAGVSVRRCPERARDAKFAAGRGGGYC